jgi:hypothetical protein
MVHCVFGPPSAAHAGLVAPTCVRAVLCYTMARIDPSISEAYFGEYLSEARILITQCARESWYRNEDDDRLVLIDLLRGIPGFRTPGITDPWKKVRPVVERAVAAGPFKFVEIIKRAYVGPRVGRTHEFYRRLGVTVRAEADGAVGAEEPVPEPSKFAELCGLAAPEERAECRVWLAAVALRGYESWHHSAVSAIDAICRSSEAPDQEGASEGPVPCRDAAAPEAFARSDAGDSSNMDEQSPIATSGVLESESLTPLDQVFIDLAIAAVAGQTGARDIDEVAGLGEELQRLNSKRVTSWFHIGFLSALRRQDLPPFSGAGNAIRRAWMIAGWLSGHGRREGVDAYARFEALTESDRHCLLSSRGAMSEIANTYVSLLRKLDRPSDLKIWLRYASSAARAEAIAFAQDCLRSDRPSEAASIASLLGSTQGTATELLDVMLVEVTAARMLRNFGQADKRLSILRKVGADLRDGFRDLPEEMPSEIQATLLALERDIRTQWVLCRGKIRRVEEVWISPSAADRSVVVMLEGISADLLKEVEEVSYARSLPLVYLACLLVLSRPELQRTHVEACLAASAQSIAEAQGRPTSAFGSRIMNRLVVLRAILVSYTSGTGLVDAIASIVAFERREQRLPFHAVQGLIEAGLSEGVDRVADLIVPRLQADLPHLLSSGILADALANPAVCTELASHVAEYLRPLAGPKQIQVRAELFRTVVDANGPKTEVVQMADELIGTAQAYPSSALVAIDALLERDRWTRVWTEEDFVAIHAELAHGCDETYRSAARARAMGRARYFARHDPDVSEECLELADWLGEPLESVSGVRLMIDRLASSQKRADRSQKSQSMVRVLFVGGDERQKRLQHKITELVDGKRANVKIGFEHPGWSSNWGPKLERVVARLKDFDAVVLLRFTRTIYGERLRAAIGAAGKQWRPTYGHGAPSIARAILSVADEVGA